jgi:hypothetical protein
MPGGQTTREFITTTASLEFAQRWLYFSLPAFERAA